MWFSWVSSRPLSPPCYLSVEPRDKTPSRLRHTPPPSLQDHAPRSHSTRPRMHSNTLSSGTSNAGKSHRSQGSRPSCVDNRGPILIGDPPDSLSRGTRPGSRDQGGACTRTSKITPCGRKLKYSARPPGLSLLLDPLVKPIPPFLPPPLTRDAFPCGFSLSLNWKAGCSGTKGSFLIAKVDLDGSND